MIEMESRLGSADRRVWAICRRQFGHHNTEIVAHATVIERWGQVFASSTGSLIKPKHIKSGPPGFGPETMHIMRFTTTFEPVDQEHSVTIARFPLPMAQG